MKTPYLAGTVGVLLLMTCIAKPASAQEVVLNDGFEMQHWDFWSIAGNLPLGERGVLPFDTAIPGKYSYSYSQHTWDGVSGGLTQTLYVQAGVTYTVSVKMAYDTC